MSDSYKSYFDLLIEMAGLKPRASVIAIEKEVNAEIERQHHRYQPDSLKDLVADTNFSRRELQLLYRGFKEICPNGIVTLPQFRQIFEQFFPYGDPSTYANLVFSTFDEDGNGEICFDEFVKALSVLSRGTFEEKVHWTFSLYDSGNKGYITVEDMHRIVAAMYDMLGSKTSPPIKKTTTRAHTEDVFKKMDDDGNGSISYDEFLACCQKDPAISASMELFRTAYAREAP